MAPWNAMAARLRTLERRVHTLEEAALAGSSTHISKVPSKIQEFYIGEEPAPMTQEETVHVPKVVNHHRHHHVEVEQIVDIRARHEREEIVHVPKIIPQERIIQQTVEQVAEVPVPMTLEEIALLPTVVNHHEVKRSVAAAKDLCVKGAIVVKRGVVGTVVGPSANDPEGRITVAFARREDGRCNNLNVVPAEIVDIHVPHGREKIVHAPKIVPQDRIIQQTVEQLVQVPGPMTQEEVVHVPKIDEELKEFMAKVTSGMRAMDGRIDDCFNEVIDANRVVADMEGRMTLMLEAFEAFESATAEGSEEQQNEEEEEENDDEDSDEDSDEHLYEYKDSDELLYEYLYRPRKGKGTGECHPRPSSSDRVAAQTGNGT